MPRLGLMHRQKRETTIKIAEKNMSLIQLTWLKPTDYRLQIATQCCVLIILFLKTFVCRMCAIERKLIYFNCLCNLLSLSLSFSDVSVFQSVTIEVFSRLMMWLLNSLALWKSIIISMIYEQSHFCYFSRMRAFVFFRFEETFFFMSFYLLSFFTIFSLSLPFFPHIYCFFCTSVCLWITFFFNL